jgi:hypothetical protein
MATNNNVFINISSNQKINSYQIIKFHYGREFAKPNIKALVEKWIPCDLLWTTRFLGFKYTMRLRRNEEYCPKEIESKELWSTMMILDSYNKI